MPTVTETAFAKINLFLDVTGRRSDGYHTIRSVMQTVTFGDTVTVEKADRTVMTCDDPTLSCGPDNLCRRAAEAFFAARGEAGGCRIALVKRIPCEAGLGGGSADGAAVLRALNRLYGEPFSLDRLAAVGAAIGADVPFCVVGGTRLAEGIGERLSPCPPCPPCSVVIADGIGKSATAAAYRALDALPDSRSEGEAAWRRFSGALAAGSLTALGKALYNRFEAALPAAGRVVSLLDALGADGARMTGSGSAVYGLFADPDRAAFAARALRTAGFSAVTAGTV